MQKVPKCKECEHRTTIDVFIPFGHGWKIKHICNHTKQEYGLKERAIGVKCPKARPKWCPLRKENVHANKI